MRLRTITNTDQRILKASGVTPEFTASTTVVIQLHEESGGRWNTTMLALTLEEVQAILKVVGVTRQDMEKVLEDWTLQEETENPPR